MSNLNQLRLVAKIESDKEKQCALDYQHASEHLRMNQQKLAGLENYRLDYLRTIRLKASQGLEARAMSQHHQFVGKLDKACEQQIQIINQAILVADQRKQQWLAQQKKSKAIVHLIESKQLQQKALRAKLEQKQLDEYSIQRFIRRQ